MKRTLILIAVFFLTILQTNGRDYYVREVDLELAPLKEVLGNFIIPFAKANGFSYVNNHIEVLIDNNEIIVQLVRAFLLFIVIGRIIQLPSALLLKPAFVR